MVYPSQGTFNNSVVPKKLRAVTSQERLPPAWVSQIATPENCPLNLFMLVIRVHAPLPGSIVINPGPSSGGRGRVRGFGGGGSGG